MSFILFLFFAAFGLPADISTLAEHKDNVTDQLALLAIKSQIKHDPHGILTSWNIASNINFCQWYGITCGRKHQRVTRLNLATQKLTGSISPFIGNLSFLRILDLRNNSFGDAIPQQITNLKRIEALLLRNNSLDGNIPRNLSACYNLGKFDVYKNKLAGEIPPELGSLPRLENLALAFNELTGQIPSSFGNLSSLITLFLTSNQLTGSIPGTLGMLTNLVSFAIAGNKLSGTVPSNIFNLSYISVFDVGSNQLQGVLPSYIGNSFPRLNFFGIGKNNFTGSIPISLSNASELIKFYALNNNLTGKIPKFEISSKLSKINLLYNQLGNGGEFNDLSFFSSLINCTDLKLLELAFNNLGGILPVSFLGMQENFFRGQFPSSFAALRGLQSLNLSQNNISGPIPDFLGDFKLQYLNLSFNDFEGEVPNKGIFKNASVVFVDGNKRLCGGVPELKLSLCITKGSENKSRFSTYKVLVIMIVGFLGLALISCFLLFCWIKRKRPKKTLESSDHVHYRVSYQSLVAATNGFSSANKIGSGGFGSVYRGNLEDGSFVAVKVLNLEHHAAAKSFMAECDAFKNIRHCNLVKLLTVCSSTDYQGNDYKAVVYEFMVNGNLDEWLHPVQTENMSHGQQKHLLNLLDRLNIAIDVVSALNYLHNDCQPPIIHCDIKPSNILLDREMTVHVGDFGLSRFIFNRNHDAVQSSSIVVRGTIG